MLSVENFDKHCREIRKSLIEKKTFSNELVSVYLTGMKEIVLGSELGKYCEMLVSFRHLKDYIVGNYEKKDYIYKFVLYTYDNATEQPDLAYRSMVFGTTVFYHYNVCPQRNESDLLSIIDDKDCMAVLRVIGKVDDFSIASYEKVLNLGVKLEEILSKLTTTKLVQNYPALEGTLIYYTTVEGNKIITLYG